MHIPFSEEVLNFSLEVMSFWAPIQEDRDHAAVRMSLGSLLRASVHLAGTTNDP
ncbi:MAG TPA: hypothetical protein VMW26_05035 [Methanomassiliicoccales archaeon]|nr:hypothetical protein [Methanomassiliicoccales archaeon]